MAQVSFITLVTLKELVKQGFILKVGIEIVAGEPCIIKHIDKTKMVLHYKNKYGQTLFDKVTIRKGNAHTFWQNAKILKEVTVTI